MKITLKWHQVYADWVSTLTNAAVLEETMVAAQGDDYDGCFTARGQWEYGYLQEELDKRLPEGWLEEKPESNEG